MIKVSKVISISAVIILCLVMAGCSNNPGSSSSSSSSATLGNLISTWVGTTSSTEGGSPADVTAYLYDNQTTKVIVISTSGGTGTGTGSVSFAGTNFTADNITGTANNASNSPSSSPFTLTLMGSTNATIMKGTYGINYSAWSATDAGTFTLTKQ